MRETAGDQTHHQQRKENERKSTVETQIREGNLRNQKQLEDASPGTRGCFVKSKIKIDDP